MGISNTSDHIKIKIKMPNPRVEPPASSKAPNEDLKDMDVLCTLKIKIMSQNSESVCTKDQWPYPNQYQDAKPQSGTFSVLQSPNDYFKDMDVLCTFKIKIESINLDHGCIKDQWPYPNQNQDANPSQEPPASSKPPNEDLKAWMFFASSKSR